MLKFKVFPKDSQIEGLLPQAAMLTGKAQRRDQIMRMLTSSVD